MLFGHRSAALITGLATFVIAITIAIAASGSRPAPALVGASIASAIVVAGLVGFALKPKNLYFLNREDVESALQLPVLADHTRRER